jgi:hypothetical protein
VSRSRARALATFGSRDNHPGRLWASPSYGLDSATGEEIVAAMNSVGVDGAIMVSSFSAYEYDPSYALEVYNTYRDKFRVVTSVNATHPAIDGIRTKLDRARTAPRRLRNARTIEMADERSQEVFRLLVQAGRAFTFAPGRARPGRLRQDRGPGGGVRARGRS